MVALIIPQILVSDRPLTQWIGLFKVLILCSQEGEHQRGLCGNRPLRIGNGPIVQLTQERDGAVPNTAQPMPDLPPVQAVFIVGHITHPEDPVFHRPMGLQPGERLVRGQRPGKRSASNPDVAARCFPSGAPARSFDPAAPLRAGPDKRLFQILAEVAARRHPQRPALAGVLALALHCLPLRISAMMPMPWYCADPVYGALGFLAFPVNLLTNDLAQAIWLAPLSLITYMLLGIAIGSMLGKARSPGEF
jgi:hypothetical protein